MARCAPNKNIQSRKRYTLVLTLRQKLFPVKFIERYVYSIIIYEKDLRFRKKRKKKIFKTIQ